MRAVACTVAQNTSHPSLADGVATYPKARRIDVPSRRDWFPLPGVPHRVEDGADRDGEADQDDER